MKKIFALILALTMVFALAACGGETAPETTAPAANAPGKTDPSSWKYTVRGVDVLMNAEAAPVLEALGEPVSFTEDIFETVHDRETICAMLLGCGFELCQCAHRLLEDSPEVATWYVVAQKPGA